MTGDKLKNILLEYKVSQSEIARQLSISQQSFNQMLSSSDVKSSLLERIAAILGISVSRFYGEEGASSTVAPYNGNVGTGNVNMSETSVLQERIILLERLLDEKERTIKILMDK